MKEKMITEDYVSFETAKLLKEKGFDEKCNSVWRFTSNSPKRNGKYILYGYNMADKDSIWNPTHQMAMKWLREVHNISIEPLVDFGSGDGYWWTADVGYIKKNGLIDELCGYDSYEEAVETAIKYCLKNLI